ncbi:helix-turn-helix transcriptional regulator [Fusibacter bizertensis]
MRTWFKHARELKNLSQGKLAKQVGVSRQFIGMIENGKATPRPEKAKALADILDTDWTHFYDSNDSI